MTTVARCWHDACGSDTGGDPVEVPQECQIAGVDTALFVIGELGEIDETCVVLASAVVDEALEMTLDCPKFALVNGGKPTVMKVQHVPLPAAPLVGESLEVLYQYGDFEGFLDLARPEMLFLRRDGVLLLAVIHGYFLFEGELARVETHALPMTVELVQGPCAPVPTGWDGDGDGVRCKYEAVSQLKVTGDAGLLLAPGQVGELAAGGHSYIVDVREALHRTQCVDMDENIYYSLAIAQK